MNIEGTGPLSVLAQPMADFMNPDEGQLRQGNGPFI